MLVFKHTKNTPASWLLHMLHHCLECCFLKYSHGLHFFFEYSCLNVILIRRSFLTTYQTFPSLLLFLLIASACHCLFFSITSENLPNWLNYPLLQYIEGSSWVVVGVKTLPANAGDVRLRFDSQVGKIPWRRKRQATLVFLPGEFYGQRSLVGYSLWGCDESEATQHTHCIEQYLSCGKSLISI